MDKNGPNGTSDFIVRFFLNTNNNNRAQAAPVQKAMTTAERPWTNPKRKPITAMYFTSPSPNHRPSEIKNKIKNGKASKTAERKD